MFHWKLSGSQTEEFYNGSAASAVLQETPVVSLECQDLSDLGGGTSQALSGMSIKDAAVVSHLSSVNRASW